jgi:NDP-sugar pyrophosphorylase family protein
MSNTYELSEINGRHPKTPAEANGSRRAAEHVDGLRDVKAIVLAGGRGTRLAPYTTILPKPLMPVGNRSILEIVVDQLEKAGVVDIRFSVGYLSHLIRAVFDNRPAGTATITHVPEENALGTAAPLMLMEDLDSTFIVMNGDVLTTLDFADLVRFHREHENLLTIATYHRSIKIDYGILRVDAGHRVEDFEEKPEIVSAVSMGVYVMEPEVLEHIPAGEHFDFPELVDALLDAGLPVGAYRHEGLWFDIGRHDDYEQAVIAWDENGHADVNGHVKTTNGHANGNGGIRHASSKRRTRRPSPRTRKEG